MANQYTTPSPSRFWNPYTLIFHDREIEQEYRTHTIARNLNYNRGAWLIVLAIMVELFILDPATYPDNMFVVSVAKIVVCLLGLIVIAASFVPRIRHYLIYSPSLLIVSTTTLSLLCVMLSDPSKFAAYYLGFFCGFAGIFSLVGLGFLFGSFAIGLAMILFFTYLFLYSGISSEIKLIYTTFMPPMAFIMVYVGYIVECSARQNFISNKQLLASHQEIEDQKKNLEQLNSTKDRFFSIIAHDLRGPLGSAAMLTETISENPDGFGLDEMREFFVILHKSNTQVYGLLENLLTWSRMEQGVMSLKGEHIRLVDFIRETVAPLTAQAENKGIGIEIDVPTEHSIYADRDMVSTALRNLISNAIKFSHQDSTITIGSELDHDSVRVCVIDQGIGIPETVIDKLFDMDNKYHTEGTAGEASSGLGLLLVKELVEKNQGHVSVASDQGVGSTFTIMLPSA